MIMARTAVAALLSSPESPILPKMETNAAEIADSSAKMSYEGIGQGFLSKIVRKPAPFPADLPKRGAGFALSILSCWFNRLPADKS